MSEVKRGPGYLHISDVRLSYFYGFEPFLASPSPATPNPKPVYTAHFLMAKNHPDLPRIVAAIQAVAEAEWKDQAQMMLESFKAQDKLCLHKGDVTKAGKPEYAGLYFLSASNSKPFTIIDGDRTPLRAKDGRPFSGSYANATIDIWAQNNKWGKRINCTVTGVQHLRLGDAFGSGAPPADPGEFGIVAGAADAPAPTAVLVSVDLLG
jgi:hypothetical protein